MQWFPAEKFVQSCDMGGKGVMWEGGRRNSMGADMKQPVRMHRLLIWFGLLGQAFALA